MNSKHLDYLHCSDSYFYDDGYDSGFQVTHHYRAGPRIVRTSDFPLPKHACGNATLGRQELFEYYHPYHDGLNQEDSESVVVHFCDHCGWWSVRRNCRVEQWSDKYGAYNDVFVGAQCVFDTPEEKHVIEEIATMLDEGHRELSNLSPALLERGMASVFKSYYKGDVKHVGGPNDQGVDLFCRVGASTYLIQVKRRANGKAESVATVRDLIGAYVLHTPEIATPCHAAHVLTTAPHFSRQARQASTHEALKQFGFRIGLHSYSELKELLHVALSSNEAEEPWRALAVKCLFTTDNVMKRSEA